MGCVTKDPGRVRTCMCTGDGVPYPGLRRSSPLSSRSRAPRGQRRQSRGSLFSLRPVKVSAAYSETGMIDTARGAVPCR
eukprot:1178504-Prorocentrum_minimum.AAC.1